MKVTSFVQKELKMRKQTIITNVTDNVLNSNLHNNLQTGLVSLC
jgi:hypothetical protein